MNSSSSDTPKSQRLARAKEFLKHLEPDSIDLALALLSPSAQYQVLGSNEQSGTFRGHHEIRDHLSRLYERIGSSLDFLKWEDWLEGESSVVGIALVHAQDPSRRYASRQLFLFQFDRENLINLFTVVFLDEEVANRFFAASDPG